MNPIWTTLAARAGLEIDDARADQVSKYLDLLLAANQTMNLTRITDRAAAERGHVGDAMTLLPHLPQGPLKLADVGSGGGVPGIVLAILRPELTVALIESTAKKAAFLSRTVDELKLSNVTIFTGRAEDAGHGPMRESFDIAVARAVATMDWLAEWCLPLVKIGGKVLAMKGPRVAEELPAAARAITHLGGTSAIVHPVESDQGEHHVIVEITKRSPTPAKFPRPASIAKGRAIQ